MHSSRVVILILAVIMLTFCGPPSKQLARVNGGNADKGASAITRYGCGSCHTIPGIVGAHGLVGPPLAGIGNRMYVAGILPNEPPNLMHWVEDPKSINEKTVMPNLGVTTPDAYDIAAYLYSLK